MALSKKQQEYILKANKRWNFKTGATRSGKTFLDFAYMIPWRIMNCKGDGLILLLGTTRSTLERNVLSPMRKIWGTHLVGEINSQNKVRLFGHQCYALGADKINQASKIQGSGVEYCYGDEVATWHEDVFQMLKSRLDKEKSCFDGTCNPDHPNHWLKKFLDSDADVYHQHYTIDDNPFLSQRFVADLKQEYRGTVQYDRFILGLWTRAEGLVYPQFSREKHVCAREAVYDGVFYVSVDYGTRNPFSAGLWQIRDGIAYREAEYYYSGRAEKHDKTDSEYYDELVKLIDGRAVDYIVVDPSASSFIAEINARGDYNVVKARNAVLDGIRMTAKHLNKGRLMFNATCENCIREFGAYSWDDQKLGEDQVIKEEDHAMDDIRYFVTTVFEYEVT